LLQAADKYLLRHALMDVEVEFSDRLGLVNRDVTETINV